MLPHRPVRHVRVSTALAWMFSACKWRLQLAEVSTSGLFMANSSLLKAMLCDPVNCLVISGQMTLTIVA